MCDVCMLLLVDVSNALKVLGVLVVGGFQMNPIAALSHLFSNRHRIASHRMDMRTAQSLVWYGLTKR